MRKLFVEIDVSALAYSELQELREEINLAISQRATQLVTPNQEEKELAKTSKIEAIKAYRLRVGCYLKDAKETIDRFC